ncbi:MAG: putative sulfate exporter family transporter [Myxococcaceae bacterium]|nr:putative sulfate exporter family transporter [Myxococcaceae bacterium]
MTRRVLFFALAAGALLPWVPTWVALLAGLAFGLSVEHPFPDQAKKAQTYLLQASVVGLGASMNLAVVLRVGVQGIGQTLVAITATLLAALGLARLFKTEQVTSLLIGVGTAICGGSAIAAVAPAIGAKPHQTSVSLAVVFLLNAVALVVFPPIGHAAALDAPQFGLWSALAIHDTSSVVGASMQFGEQALQVGTTVKLTRALWIVPLTLVLARLAKAEDGGKSTKKPWFILGFLAVAALVTWVPALTEPGQVVARVARQVLVLTLFLIGASVNRAALKAVGVRPLVLGVVLWLLVSVTTLWLIHRAVLAT